ncbi:MAG TPA: hypothetical protein VK789_29990 [Bryobacteraceae bacterium]|jgi:hypothetical protein|nr:hypothetical protein [Bryobacteraceae bacterium]
MTNERDLPARMLRRYLDGATPSEILHEVCADRPNIPIPELMILMESAFSLELPDVSCIGGWEPDGTGELNDQQLDYFLTRSIEQKRA